MTGFEKLWTKLFGKKRNAEHEKPAPNPEPDAEEPVSQETAATVSPPDSPAAEPDQPESQPEEKYTYRAVSVSKTERWIFVLCNEEDTFWEVETFTELVKYIARKWNDGEWEGKIISAGLFSGDTRYRILNDPMNLVYQYDGLFGIALEYGPGADLKHVLDYLDRVLNIAVDEKLRGQAVTQICD